MYELGKTKCGEILMERIQAFRGIFRKKIIVFIVSTFYDAKRLKRAAENKNHYQRLRTIYLLGRFKQLDEFSSKNNLDPDILQRMKYVIRFHSRNGSNTNQR
jgi:hypothetical protein